MEGGGEGMVAIVQNLRPTGLAVTFLNGVYQGLRRKDGTDTGVVGRLMERSDPSIQYIPPIKRPPTRDTRNVETSTETRVPQKNTSSQAYDGRYASSYQLAHCSRRPTSPPVHLSEFPPQRMEPCRTQGNFEIGGNRSHDSCTPSIPSSIYKDGWLYPDKVSKSSCHSKSLKSLRENLDSECKSKLSKDKQIYTMKQDTSTKESTSGQFKKPRSKELRLESPTYETRSIKYKDNHINETYDYLKSTNILKRCPPSKRPEVRYLTDMTRRIRDSLRHLCDDQTTVCPKIRSRYYLHKREHHKDSAPGPSTTDYDSDNQELMSGHQGMNMHCRAPAAPHQSAKKSKYNCRCKQKSSKDYINLVEQQILDWLQTIPVFPNDSLKDKEKRQQTVKQLAQTLAGLKGDPEYDNKVKNEVNEYLTTIPMWLPGPKQDQDLFKKHIADSLLDRLKGLSESSKVECNKSQEAVSKYVDKNKAHIDNQNEDNFLNKAKIPNEQKYLENYEDFVNELKPIAQEAPFYSGTHKKSLELDSEMFQNMPIKIEDKKEITIKNLADDLTDELQNVIKGTSRVKKRKLSDSQMTGEIIQHIWEWFNDIPEIGGGSETENKKLVENLANKLASKDLKHLNNRDVRNEINSFIESLSEKRGQRIDNKHKQNLINKLQNKLCDSKQRRNSSEDHKELIQKIQSWLSDSPDTRQFLENEWKIEQLASRLRKLQSQIGDDKLLEQEMINEIIYWMNISGLKTDEQRKENLAKNLLLKVISRPGQLDDKDRQRKNSNNKVRGQQKEAENLSLKKPSPKQRKRWSTAQDEEKDNEESFESSSKPSFSKKENTEDQTTVNKVFSNNESLPPITDLKKYIREEISDILNETNKSISGRDEVESNLTDLIADQVMRGVVDDKIKPNIDTILKNCNLSREDVDNISSKLLGRSKQLMLMSKTKDSYASFIKNFKNKGEKSLSPVQQHILVENAEKEINDFVEEMTDDRSTQSKQQRKEATRKLAERLGEIVTDSEKSPLEKENSIKSEIARYLEKLRIKLHTPQNKLVSKLVDRLHNIGLSTSTPRTSRVDEYTFQPKRATIIDSDDTYTRSLSNEEEQYMKEIMIIIGNWMNKLRLDLDATEDTGFIETIRKDLAGDILDRQKYLQLNPDAKTSDEEELKHLNYQVFRWLNKIQDINDFNPLMSDTEQLMKQIKSVPVPQLVKKRVAQDLMPNFFDPLRDEILTWLQDMPSYLLSIDDKYFRQMVEELASKLESRKVRSEIDIQKDIQDWLGKVIRSSSIQDLSKMTSELKERLKRTGLFKENSSKSRQDSDQLSQENLVGAVQGWLKDLPLYQRKSQQEKRQIEQLGSELARNVNRIIGEYADSSNIDQLLRNEIIKYLKKIPLEGNQLNATFPQTTADQLLQHLKGLQMFQNLFSRYTQVNDGKYLTDDIESWLKNLPLQPRRNSSEQRHFDNLKKNFIVRINEIRKEYPPNSNQCESRMREEIKKYLNSLPLSANLDETFLNKKIEELIISVSNVPLQTVTRHPISHDILKDTIKKWVNKFPLQCGNIPNKEIENFTSELYKCMGSDLDANMNKITEETVKFLKKFPLKVDTQDQSHVNKLPQKLFDEITSSTKTTTKPFQKPGDVIYDNVNSWCDQLPISEGVTPEENERVKTMKQNLATKLINKIGELNMNPEIFNDNFLYEDILSDEIERLISTLPESPDLINKFPALKAGLIEKIKEAKALLQDELEGQNYKQQLRGTISKTLPLSKEMTPEELASFEAMKDNVADAFINLGYVGDNEELKNKYKTRIKHEINKFCDEYIKQHPDSSFDINKVNQELYTALKNVPVPKENTMKSEVEQARMKDEINDWIKDLPLEEVSGSEQIQRNKMVAVLAKRLHEIEKKADYNSLFNTHDKMKSEISNFLKKIPLNTSDKAKIGEIAEKLTNKLKETEESRRLSASTTRQPIDSILSSSSNGYLEPSAECSNACHMPINLHTSLNDRDKSHLERIRNRNNIITRSTKSPDIRDASVSPLPVDIGSQIEIRPSTQNKDVTSPETRRISQGTGSDAQMGSPCSRVQEGSQVEISPYVVVKEYYWDSVDSSKPRLLPCALPRSPCPQLPCVSSQLGSPHQRPPCTPRIPCISPRLSCMTPATSQISKQTCLERQTLQNRPPCHLPHQTPGSSQHPFISPRSSVPHTQPYPENTSQIPSTSTQKKTVVGNKNSNFYQNMSDNNHEIGTSKSCTPCQKPKVIRLGSFDDIKTSKTRKSKDKISDDDFEWSTEQFPEGDFWETCSRPHICGLPSDIEFTEPVTRERTRKEENLRCRCKEQTITTCIRRPRNSFHRQCHRPPSNDSVRHCTRCCGLQCPHPSYLYFRQ